MGSSNFGHTKTALVLGGGGSRGEVKRVVFAGSSSAYGGNPALPRLESREPRSLSPYA
jgi:nucleoside-diphosphate-sugar epimerase